MATTGLAAAACRPPDSNSASSSKFVGAADGNFVLDGRAWRFGGSNCYYLHEGSHHVIDLILESAAAMGLAVIRCWAFSDGNSRPKPLQPVPYEYPEDAYDSIDYTAFRADQLGLKLVLPLVNNWSDYGGMQQYVSWFLGLPDDTYGESHHHDRFYTDSSIRACFKAYAANITGRTNRYTGRRYCEDQTIMAWELANEPRNRSDGSGMELYQWASEMSSYLKNLAPHQLVAVGDEGFGLFPEREGDDPYGAYEGNRWLDLVGLENVDYGTAHLYPQTWRRSLPYGIEPIGWGREWITTHASEGRRLAKPIVLEEFGLQVNPKEGVASPQARALAYQAWLDAAEECGISGTQFWVLGGPTAADILGISDDGFQVSYPSPTADVFTRHAHKMRNSAGHSH